MRDLRGQRVRVKYHIAGNDPVDYIGVVVDVAKAGRGWLVLVLHDNGRLYEVHTRDCTVVAPEGAPHR